MRWWNVLKKSFEHLTEEVILKIFKKCFILNQLQVCFLIGLSTIQKCVFFKIHVVVFSQRFDLKKVNHRIIPLLWITFTICEKLRERLFLLYTNIWNYIQMILRFVRMRVAVFSFLMTFAAPNCPSPTVKLSTCCH